jgi:hypothetical protein
MNYSGALIKNNIIIGNSGGEDFGGGGLWFLHNGEKPLILENNTIVNNSSALGGGGIRVWFCDANIINNIFWGNTASTSPQIQGYNSNVSYSCVEGGFNGTGIIQDDPEFLAGTYILSDGSPCVDAGDPAISYYDPEDPANTGHALYPSKGSLHADMGAYGGPGCMLLPDVITGIWSHSDFNNDLAVRVYPNPAVSTINIELKTDELSKLEVQICDSNKVIKKLSAEKIGLNGVSVRKVDISDLSPGVYFITIRSSQNVSTYKFVKI